jgi:precorrin-4 methylase
MGLAHVAELAEGLIANGRDPATAAAVVERGTTADQRRVVAPLGELAELAQLGDPARRDGRRKAEVVARRAAQHRRAAEVESPAPRRPSAGPLSPPGGARFKRLGASRASG